MKKKLTLTQYVKRRNGVHLGGAGSLSNMLHRSLGAGSFSLFWRYWNPIWGYFLGKYVYSPLKTKCANPIAVVLTFTLSGILHDIAISIIKLEIVFVITPWFFLIGITHVCLELANLNYKQFNWYICASINICLVLSNYVLSLCF